MNCSIDEKPADSCSEPVGRSSTSTCNATLSGAVPGFCFTSSFSWKKPRLWIRSRERFTLIELKASPSARRNSRRITSSRVRVLPLIVTDST